MSEEEQLGQEELAEAEKQLNIRRLFQEMTFLVLPEETKSQIQTFEDGIIQAKTRNIPKEELYPILEAYQSFMSEQIDKLPGYEGQMVGRVFASVSSAKVEYESGHRSECRDHLYDALDLLDNIQVPKDDPFSETVFGLMDKIEEILNLTKKKKIEDPS